MNNNEIYKQFFTRIYFFTQLYSQDKNIVQDIVAEAFVALFNDITPGNGLEYEKVIGNFLYDHVEQSLEKYYVETLGIACPAPEDFFNSRLDGELLNLLKLQTKD